MVVGFKVNEADDANIHLLTTAPLSFKSTDTRVGPNPSSLKPSTAFRIFPIAHQYDLRVVLEWCFETVGATQPMPLWPSSEPVTSASVPYQPGLVQWLALADQKHCEELVGSCVTQLTASDGDVMRQALVSRHLGPLVDGLSSETKSGIIWKMAGLPLSIKVSLLVKDSMTSSILTIFCTLGWQQDARCGESSTIHDVRAQSLRPSFHDAACFLPWHPVLHPSH